MATKKKVTVGDLIDQMGSVNAEIADLNKELKVLQGKKAGLQEELLAECDALGIERAGGKFFTASITEEDVAKVEDWDAFYAFCRRNNSLYLLQRRVSMPAIREVWSNRGKRPIPGVDKAQIKKLNFRKVAAK